MAYDKLFIAGLEWIWGKGFLSPGGPEEIAEILSDTKLVGKSVLDIGCGIGGIDQLLVTQHGASKVTGIDVEPELVQRAVHDAKAAGLDDRIEFALVAEGPLKFQSASFDVVFSKDSIIHVADKLPLCQEVFRVLCNGGIFVGSDWLAGKGYDKSPAVAEWLDILGLEFSFSEQRQFQSMLHDAGFEAVRLRDRNEWYRQAVRDEIELIAGSKGAKFKEMVGENRARHRLLSSTAKRKVVDEGSLRPTHFKAVKPS